MKLQRILLPTDFSDESLTAMRHAAMYARQFDAELVVLHVLETYAYNAVLDNLGTSYQEIVGKGIEEKLWSLITDQEDMVDLSIQVRIEEGKVHRVIRAVAEEEDISLIVMGTHGASGAGHLDKMVLGSNAYRVMNSSTVPVLTIRNAQKHARVERIVLPLDITKKTTLKVNAAIDMAKKFGASIYLVAITEFFDDFNPKIDRVPKALEEVEHRISAAGISCSAAQIKYKDVAKGVIDYADEVRADLIIIMTRQETILEEWLLGSHARKIISQSTVPVLSLRPAAH